VAEHFSSLVYPFEYRIPTRDGKHDLRHWGDRWRPWWQDRPDSPKDLRASSDAGRGDDVVTLLDDTFFFLPHIRRVLMPEVANLPKGKPRHQLSAFLNQLARESIDSPVLSANDSVRLRVKENVREEIKNLTLTQRSLKPGMPVLNASVKLNEIEVWFFPPNLGFLTLHIQVVDVDESTPSVRDLCETLSCLRWIHGANSTWILPEWSIKGDTSQSSLSFRSEDLVDFLLQEAFPVTDKPEAPLPLATCITSIRASQQKGNAAISRGATVSEFGQTHGEIFLLFTWAALQPASQLASDSIGSGIFKSSDEKWLWELANFANSARPESEPHPQGLARWRETEVYAEWQNWQGSIGPGHVVFLGVKTDDWIAHTFPSIVRHDYYPLYMLAVMQRMRLHQILPESQAERHGPAASLGEMQELWDEFVAFENKFWFTEVTGKPQGERLYKLFQEALGAQLLYEELRRQIEDIKGQLEQRFERRMNRLLRFIAYIGVPLGMLGDMFGHWLAAIDPFAKIGLPAFGAYAVNLVADSSRHPEASRFISWLGFFGLLGLLCAFLMKRFPLKLRSARRQRQPRI